MTGLAGLGGGILTAGTLLVTGVGRAVVDTTLGAAGFSCFAAGGGFGGGAAKAGRNGVESPLLEFLTLYPPKTHQQLMSTKFCGVENKLMAW